MLPRARRLADHQDAAAFVWQMGGDLTATVLAPSAPDAAPRIDAEQIAREAFERGFAEGREVGTAAEAERARAELARLVISLDELAAARSDMIRATEHQMVELALAISRRIVQREVSLDRDLLVSMAHVALQRLEQGAAVTVRFNPDDYASTVAAQTTRWAGTPVTVTPDNAVPRGGCRIESTFGRIDAGVEAQLQEVGLALLGTPLAEASPGA